MSTKKINLYPKKEGVRVDKRIYLFEKLLKRRAYQYEFTNAKGTTRVVEKEAFGMSDEQGVHLA